jgi:hypothetical protein
MSELIELVQTSAAAVAALGDFAALSDDDLVSAQKPLAALRSHVDALVASLAGEISHRSARELGHSGLAQRNGFVNASAMIESGSHLTGADAAKLVTVGHLMSNSAPVDRLSWRSIVAEAVRHAALSVDSANSITRGLSGIDDRVAAVDICEVTHTLITRATLVTPDKLFRAARRERDRLDSEGIASREEQRRQQRYFAIRLQPDGMYRGSFLLDPEAGQLVSSAIEAVLSPRRGGPRFVDPAAKAAAEQLIADPRSNEQIAADAFTDLIRLAVDADSTTMVGSRRPAVRVIVHDYVVTETAGAGALEANPDPISYDTVARHICNTGIIGVKFDDNGTCINIGRTQRLFTERQRVGMAVRDGGCIFLDCDRPPSWCEAHHIDEWEHDHGETNLADGVLLCRLHHMLLHNNHWKITRNKAAYLLTPPPEIDPQQKPIPLPSKGVSVMPVSVGDRKWRA